MDVQAPTRRTPRSCTNGAPGRVPQTCGSCFETSAIPPAFYGSAGHEPSKPDRNPSSAPVDLHLSKPGQRIVYISAEISDCVGSM
jgi:hypothetical protein